MKNITVESPNSHLVTYTQIVTPFLASRKRDYLGTRRISGEKLV